MVAQDEGCSVGRSYKIYQGPVSLLMRLRRDHLKATS